MPEKKPKKLSFTEQDAAALAQRYDATTVLTLLQEVSQYPGAKIDWNELVKKTSTGISSAREYQMLWRHLAYNDSLLDNMEHEAEPLDDDSDLECELEVLPPVSAESATEAAACVKVMIASHALNESTPSSSTIEAPLTINVPVCHSPRTSNESSQPSNLMQATNITFPVTVPRQTLPTVLSTEVIETKGLGGGNMASKRKRQTWSEEEDIQLRAAVQKFGEGNWATMAKGDDFPIKKSTTQLSQRWAILKKRDGNTNSGAIMTTSTPYTTAEQLATRHSLAVALDMPLTAPGKSDPARKLLNMSSKNQVHHRSTEASKVQSSSVPHHQPMSRGNSTPNAAVKATAIAVGARIVSPLDTTTQLKVAQARNVVPTTNSSLVKSSTLAGLASESKVQTCTSSSVAYVPSKSVAAITSSASCTRSSVAHVPSQSVIAVTSSVSCPINAKAVSSKGVDSPSTLSILSSQDKQVSSVVNKVTVKKQEINSTSCTKSSVALVPSQSVVVVTTSASCPAVAKAVSSKGADSPSTLSILSGQDKQVSSVVNKVTVKKQEINPTSCTKSSVAPVLSQSIVAVTTSASCPVVAKAVSSKGVDSPSTSLLCGQDKQVSSVVNKVTVKKQEINPISCTKSPIPSQSVVAVTSSTSCHVVAKVVSSKGVDSPSTLSSSVAPVPLQSVAAVTSSASCTVVAKAAPSKSMGSPSTLSIFSGKDKQVSSVVSKVIVEQEINLIKELKGSDPSLVPKEMVQNNEKLTQDKSICVPVKEGATSVVVDSNMDKGSQDLNQPKSKNSMNESSDQIISEKQANVQS